MIVTPDGSSAIRGIHCVDCLTTGPQSVSERVLHRIRSSASSFNFQYLLVSLTSSNSCLRLLPGLPVPSSICTSITCFYKAVPTQDVTNIVSLPSLYFMHDVHFFIDSMQYSGFVPSSWDICLTIFSLST